MNKVRLFCFPHAGGAAELIYRDWNEYLSPFIEVIPVELAGRGRRVGQPLCGSLDEMVRDVYHSIRNHLSQPFAIFGHSLGGLIAYELIYKIMQNNQHHNLVHLFISGKNPPHVLRDYKKLYLLPDEEFIKELINLGGTPNELLKENSLFDFFLPILRADFRVAETYNFEEKNKILSCPISVFYGTEDNGVLPSKIDEWSKHTTNNIDIINFPGDHFYIDNNLKEITEIINNKIKGSIEVNK